MTFLFDKYWIADLAVWTQLLPILAFLRLRRRPPALTILAVLLSLSFAVDAYEAYLGAHHINNLWASHLFAPLEGTLILWSFSYWQAGRTAQLTVRVAAALYFMVSCVLESTIERLDRYPATVYPLISLLVLAVSAYTIVTQARLANDPLPRHDWFWVSIAWCLYQATTVITQPLANMLLATRSPLLLPLFNLRAATQVVSYTLMGVGMFAAARHREPEPTG